MMKKNMVFLMLLVAAPAAAEVTLTPDLVDLRDLAQTPRVRVLHDGQALAAADIRKVVAGVYKTGDAVPEQMAAGHFFNRN